MEEKFEDLEYLKTEYESIIFNKSDIIKMLSLTSRIAQNNSVSIEASSLSFFPMWEYDTATVMITNDLTHFKSDVEIMRGTNLLKDVFSIKVETLNKLKPYFRDKILIYKRDSEYYIRLLDGDLMLSVQVPSMDRLKFTAQDKEIIYHTDISEFCKILSSFKSMVNDYSDKWLSFDGEKVSLCGINFYAQSELRTPQMCILMSDIDLIIKLEQYYKDETLVISNTDSVIPKLHLNIGTTTIEIMNVLSNLNKDMIDQLSNFIVEPSYGVDTEAFHRIINIGLVIPELEKDSLIEFKDNSLLVILNNKKGDSEFNLVTKLISNSSETNEVKINLNILEKIVNTFNSLNTGISLNKIYTTVCSDNIKSIILNK